MGVAAGPVETVAVLWRKVFPGDIRDMVLGLSRDGGRSFAPARVCGDGWKITACPRLGGQVAVVHRPNRDDPLDQNRRPHAGQLPPDERPRCRVRDLLAAPARP
jgi:hypothetical protein